MEPIINVVLVEKQGCDGQPSSGASNDQCGVCNGKNECVDCTGVPYGSKISKIIYASMRLKIWLTKSRIHKNKTSG